MPMGAPATPTPARLLARGAAKRCPLCGSGRLFTGWFCMRERCPGCDHCFEREEGFFLGAYVINFIVTGVVLSLAVFVPAIALFVSRPGRSPLPLIVAGLAAAVVVPVVFYPFSKTIWSAIDLAMRPLDDKERARLQ
jgi:hypothetical protein